MFFYPKIFLFDFSSKVLIYKSEENNFLSKLIKKPPQCYSEEGEKIALIRYATLISEENSFTVPLTDLKRKETI